MQTGVFQTDLWFGEESFDFEEATQAGLLESSGQQMQGREASQACAVDTILGEPSRNACLQIIETSAPCIQAAEQQQALLDGLTSAQPAAIAIAANVPAAQCQPAASMPEPAACQRAAQSQSVSGMEHDKRLQHVGCNQTSSNGGAISCQQQQHQQAEASSWQDQALVASSSALAAPPLPGAAVPLASLQQQHLPVEQQTKRRKTFVMPDIEEAGLCLDRRRTFRCGRGLSVTDLTASEWCQQQVAFNLSAQLPKVRPELPLQSL